MTLDTAKLVPLLDLAIRRAANDNRALAEARQRIADLEAELARLKAPRTRIDAPGSFAAERTAIIAMLDAGAQLTDDDMALRTYREAHRRAHLLSTPVDATPGFENVFGAANFAMLRIIRAHEDQASEMAAEIDRLKGKAAPVPKAPEPKGARPVSRDIVLRVLRTRGRRLVGQGDAWSASDIFIQLGGRYREGRPQKGGGVNALSLGTVKNVLSDLLAEERIEATAGDGSRFKPTTYRLLS